MCFYDLEPFEFYRQTFPRARKDHRCTECIGVIAKGQIYEFVNGKCDGEMCVFKVCEKCQDLKKKIIAHELAEGCDRSEADPGYGQLLDTAVEMGLIKSFKEYREQSL